MINNVPISQKNLLSSRLLEPCALPDFKGDGKCDDENNNEACEYDGGDCCGSNVDTSYCIECKCSDPNYGGSSTGNNKNFKIIHNKLTSTADSTTN